MVRKRGLKREVAAAVWGNVRGIPVEPVCILASGKYCPCFRDAILKVAPIGINSIACGTFSRTASIEVPSTVTAEPKIRENSLNWSISSPDRSAPWRRSMTNSNRDGGSGIAATTHRQHQRRFEEVQDLRKVRNLGSSDQPEVVTGHCPTCHQELADSLLDTANKATPMTVDQNVSFYEEQIKLFTAVHNNAVHTDRSCRKGSPCATRRGDEAA